MVQLTNVYNIYDGSINAANNENRRFLSSKTYRRKQSLPLMIYAEAIKAAESVYL